MLVVIEREELGVESYLQEPRAATRVSLRAMADLPLETIRLAYGYSAPGLPLTQRLRSPRCGCSAAANWQRDPERNEAYSFYRYSYTRTRCILLEAPGGQPHAHLEELVLTLGALVTYTRPLSLFPGTRKAHIISRRIS